MRTENSLKNISMSLINNFLITLLKFLSRTIIIKVLGEVYLGVNGILSNVLGILALADLGISNAISFCLYKPLINKEKEKIKSIMFFYKKIYFIIGTFVLILGLILLPFLPFFVKEGSFINGLYIYYLVFLINMVIGYYFSYRRTLIIADQHEYKITPIIIFTNILMNIFQIVVLFIFKNYLVYLLVQTLFILIENILVNRFVNKEYPYLNEKNIAKIDKKELGEIKTNIKALIFHKMGSYFVDSTDNIIISRYLGLATVGLYSNYFLITNTLGMFIGGASRSITASLGNINASCDTDKKYKVYKTVYFANYVIFSICSVCLYNLFNLFIGDIWLGSKYLLSKEVVLLLSIVFYINGLMHMNESVKASAGLYDKDKYVPIFQSIINIVLSIILVKLIGLPGVFVGTVISALFVMIVKPIIIYKYIFEKKVWSFYLDFIIKSLVFGLALYISSLIINLDFITNNYLAFIIYAIISVIVTLIVITLFFHRQYEYQDFLERMKNIFNKFKSQRNK